MPGTIPAQRTHREQLQQIIVGLTDGVIMLDPDRKIAWANEAALAMHGARALKDLGGTVAGYHACFVLRYRSRQRIPAHEYPLHRLMSGDAFNDLIVEVVPTGKAGKAGEPGRHWIHRVRGLVLPDPSGVRDCLVLILEDLTEQFDAEERFERTFGANPAPAIIVRLSDMRYVKVNQGFLELTGYTRDAVVGRSIHELDVLQGAEHRDTAIRHLHAGTTIPQMEARLTVADGTSRYVIVAGQPIEVGHAGCMLFSFADLHPRKLAEDTLRQSEARFALAFRMAPGPMAIMALDGLRLLDVNDAFTAATGWRREEVIGRSEIELELWGSGDARVEVGKLVKHTGSFRGLDVELKTRDGGFKDYLLSAETVTMQDHPCLLTVMVDITERKRTEVELLAAIEAVMHDTSWFGHRIAEKLTTITRTRTAPKAARELETLTPKVREVLDLVAGGLADDRIATQLGISRNTVRNHLAVIYRTLGVHRRSDVVIWAKEAGLPASRKPAARQQASKQPRRRVVQD